MAAGISGPPIVRREGSVSRRWSPFGSAKAVAGPFRVNAGPAVRRAHLLRGFHGDRGEPEPSVTTITR